MDKIRSIYWDTSCFICFLNRREAERRLICDDILRHAQRNELKIYTSTYTIAEVIRPKNKDIPNSRKLTPPEISKVGDMFRWKWLIKIDVDQRVAFKAVELSRDFGLSPADAVHAASAILWKLEELQAWDRDFSPIKHLIDCENPKRLTAQLDIEADDLPQIAPIGPSPEDFDELISGPTA